MGQAKDYAAKMRTSVMKQVIDDLAAERFAGTLGKITRDAYTAKLQTLTAMGCSINQNALQQRITREYKKRRQ